MRIALILLMVLFVLHNDFWFWNNAQLVLGIPIGLFYHIIYCFIVTGVMFFLVKKFWPIDFDKE